MLLPHTNESHYDNTLFLLLQNTIASSHIPQIYPFSVVTISAIYETTSEKTISYRVWTWKVSRYNEIHSVFPGKFVSCKMSCF